MSYSIGLHKNNDDRNSETNKIIKYKAIIKPSPKLSIVLDETNKKNIINNTSINVILLIISKILKVVKSLVQISQKKINMKVHW